MKNPNRFRTLAAQLFVAGLLLASAGSALADVHYVDVNSTNATPPYTNWATAATNIQDAVDAAVAGDEIVVANGTYATGERSVDGFDYNRVAVDKPLSIRSVNGSQSTIISGSGSVRCAYLTNGSSISGFTLTNGVATQGGGLWCESTNAVASNCVVSGNSVRIGYYRPAAGGGAYGGTLNNCALSGNLAEQSRPIYLAEFYPLGIASGGGAANCTLNNCTLTGNSSQASAGYGYAFYAPLGRFVSFFYAGDAYGGGSANCTLNDCTLTGNSTRAPFNYSALYGRAYGGNASGGGAASCTLSNCTLTGNVAQTPFNSAVNGDGWYPLYFFGPWIPGASGGGAYDCALTNCTLTNNVVRGYSESLLIATNQYGLPVIVYPFILGYGGGAFGSTLNGCTVSSNSASYYQSGGGAYNCSLNNCTLTGNYYDGAVSSTLKNCIAYFNTSQNYFSCYLDYCCTTPQPTYGLGNITNAPLFVDTNGWTDLHLQSNSPCINAGNNSYVVSATDLDGNPRIVGGTVDIGAYEFQSPASMISYAWLQQFNLPITPATDSADPDGDGVNNYHEWFAGTDPTHPFSSPAQLTITPSGVPPSGIILSWSTNAVGFSLQSTTNLGSAAIWSTNLPAPVIIGGQNVVTNPITGAQRFYRLVQ